MNVSAFVELFAIPNVPRLIAAALLGRLPGAVAPLTIVLAVHQRTGSYAAAGDLEVHIGITTGESLITLDATV